MSAPLLPVRVPTTADEAMENARRMGMSPESVERIGRNFGATAALAVVRNEVRGPQLVEASTEPDPVEAQIQEATHELAIDYAARPALPWRSVTEVVGRILSDDVWLIAAASNGGKTTILVSLVKRMAERGVRIWVVPLEEKPSVFRRTWAAVACGLETKRVLRADLHGFELAMITEHLGWQRDEAPVYFDQPKDEGLSGIRQSYLAAAQWGADLVVLDHVGLIDPPGPGYTAGKMSKGLKRMAQETAVPLVATIQLNREANKGDPLAAYKPPLVDHLQGGKGWEQGADGILGAFRPLRQPHVPADVTAWRMGEKTLKEMLEPNAVTLACLKHRVDGVAKGELIPLRWERGAIVDPEGDRQDEWEQREGL